MTEKNNRPDHRPDKHSRKPKTYHSQSKRYPNRPPRNRYPARSNTFNLGRGFLLLLLLLLGIVFFKMIEMFVIPLLLAATFATIFYPYYKVLVRVLRGHKGLASMVCCLTLLLALLYPTFLLGEAVVGQATDFSKKAGNYVNTFYDRIEAEGAESVLNSEILEKIGVTQEDITSTIKQLEIEREDVIAAAKKAGSAVANVLPGLLMSASGSVVKWVGYMFFVLFAMFFFFRDGAAMVKYLRKISPLDDKYEDKIVRSFISIAQATVMGTLLIALAQGALGAIALKVCGVEAWLLLGILMVLFSIIPIGSWVVLVPAGIIALLLGNTWQGLLLIGISLPISLLDNLLRPMLVGKKAGLHSLLVFVSTIGGIAMFGMMGFIIGPMIATLLVAILDIYGEEFRLRPGGRSQDAKIQNK